MKHGLLQAVGCYFFAWIFVSSSYSQLVVASNNNANTLVQNLVGSGVTVSNVSLNCPNGGCGTFTANNSNLGIAQGIMLTSGGVGNAVGPNNTGSSTVCTNGAGDAALTTLAGMTTYDACVLQFTFVPSASTIQFSYVFGSEEYPEFVNSGYNDVFAFFVSGANPMGGNYNNTNVALIPNTNIPVAIDNVNAGSYNQYYVNNNGGTTIQYDAFTTVLTATLNVVPCSTYVMRIAIADAGDCSYDSGVFLQYNSFNSGTFAGTVQQLTNATCNSTGSATVSASGGNGNYTYTWNTNPVQTGPTASNLNPGNYVCTVSYTSCGNVISTTVPVTISGPTPIVVNPVVNSHVSCNGGNNGWATINATGGSGGYQYTWMPGNLNGNSQPNLSAGTYTVNVVDNTGCTGTAQVVINQPAAVIANISNAVSPLCYNGTNGTISGSGSGGSGNLSYSWAPAGGNGTTANNLPAGIYTLTVTDANGCTATTSATLTNPAQLNVNVSNVVNASCVQVNNGSAQATGSGGTGNLSYVWMPGNSNNANLTNAGAGNYTVTVTDANGCTATGTATIQTNPAMTAASNILSQVSCNGGNNGSAQVSANGGNGVYTYTWMPGNLNGANQNSLSAGTYTIQITDGIGCTAQSNVVITEPTAVVISPNTSVMPSCFGGTNGTGSVIGNGGTGNITYNWMPGNLNGANQNALGAGTYTITEPMPTDVQLPRR